MKFVVYYINNVDKSSDNDRFSNSIKIFDLYFIYPEYNNICISISDCDNFGTIFPNGKIKGPLGSIYVLYHEKAYIPVYMHYIIIYLIINLS